MSDIYGVFHSRKTAEAFEQKVRGAVEEFEQGWTQEEMFANESTGYAYLMAIETPASRRAIKWATRGES